MQSEEHLVDHLSTPSPAVVEVLVRYPGDLLILGASGKMGPTLALMARRAADQVESPRRIVAVARFTDDRVRRTLEAAGIRTLTADLTDRRAVQALPDAPLVILLAGHKFGTEGHPERTWGTNLLLPCFAADRFAESRLVVCSTGNVYPLWPVHDGTPGPSEDAPLAPVGEYAMSALGRERVLHYLSLRNHTALAILRINYANECRYGVLRDIADRVLHREPIDLTMGYVNLIWQRDANRIILRALDHAATPPFVLNVTSTERASVRIVAQRFGALWNIEPVFRGKEAETALLSDARQMERLFGPVETPLDEMIPLVAQWVERGGSSLGKPTHFEQRDGTF